MDPDGDFNAKAQRRQGAKQGQMPCILAPLRLCAFALKSLSVREADPWQDF
ncbi:hypothetical protein [Sorangium sp. So ce406]|uniref:hypothetical protein n=1 Tax=Sorangium sp. So ce406 TaxID=3133311 RepID=UPI003F5C59D5